MSRQIFPTANDEERAGGWTLSVDFLMAIKEAAETYGVDTQLEDVEAVLLAAQAHAILGSLAESP